MTVYILMGVSGTGKSTVGRAAADALDIPFIDADDLHSDLSLAKMSAGVPLNSDDRRPWGDAILDRLKTVQAQHPGEPILLACSALEMKFRKALRAGLNGHAVYLHLHGDIITLKRRVKARKNHFFKADMLAGQFAALEMPHRAITLDLTQPVTAQVEIIRRIISGGERPAG